MVEALAIDTNSKETDYLRTIESDGKAKNEHKKASPCPNVWVDDHNEQTNTDKFLEILESWTNGFKIEAFFCSH